MQPTTNDDVGFDGTKAIKDDGKTSGTNGEPIDGSPAPSPSPAQAPAGPATTRSTDAEKSPEGDDDIIKRMITSGKLTEEEACALSGLSKDHAALKVKVDRLKGLLGRSAKAQREAKVELECSQKKLDQALRDVHRLKDKVEHLSSRPTHMDLLNDFETNFDKALLSVGTQPGGQDTAAPQPSIIDTNNEPPQSAVDTMLMQELDESRQRLAKLESLNSALVKRSSQLEADAREKKRERDDAMQKLSRMELELRMSRMEASHAQRAMEEKAASLEEMQMEIDLVTKASMKANVRAAQGEAVAKSSKTDRQHVLTLEAQVTALKEWALASAESKRLALERVSILEKKLSSQGGKLETALSDEGVGTTVFSKSGSLVIGAGDCGHIFVEPENSIQAGVRLLLRWKFDGTPSDLDTEFNVMKGKCITSKEQNSATYLIKGRSVTGGAAGTLEDAFSDQNACTLLWSNRKSWIRPRTVKYVVEIIQFEF